MWRRYCCLIFFSIVDTCLSWEDMARQSCATVPRWRILGDFLRSAFSVSRMQHISYLHSKFALGHTMCRGMVDIQSATAEFRRGEKKEKRRKIETTGQKYNGLPYSIWAAITKGQKTTDLLLHKTMIMIICTNLWHKVAPSDKSQQPGVCFPCLMQELPVDGSCVTTLDIVHTMA